MTALIITDIRKSNSARGLDLITAVIYSVDNYESDLILSLAKKSFNGLLVLERSTAGKEIPEIGVRKGDQFIRIWANQGHGLSIGSEIRLDGLSA